MYVHICNLHIASVRLSYFLVSKYLNKVFQQLCKLFFLTVKNKSTIYWENGTYCQVGVQIS